ncbi:class F sortase [Actinomadura sp. B10D3]|uniref:class F sortase n=1 Tax=Actinomadura sp. B10D3 TaxID=3153557 RepID=UPI00325D0176
MTARGLAAALCVAAAMVAAASGVDGRAAGDDPAARAVAVSRTSPPPRRAVPPARLPASPPVRLVIPAAGVDSPVARAGLRPDGSLEPPRPPNEDEAAWYTGSVTPGQPGTAVIEGHRDSASGPSVFYRLGRLRPGERVSVLRADRATAVFTVDAVRTFPKDGFPSRAVYGDTREPSLRLITCGGDFDARAGHYRANVVAFARLTAVLGDG